MSQLDIHGNTTDPTLGLRQSMAFAHVVTAGPVDEWEVGQMLHSARMRHRANERCFTCVRDGRVMLESLERRGLVRKTGEGWRATT